MPYNFAAESFHTQRNFVADFLREKYTLRGKNCHFAFLSPLRGLGATYAVHLRLIGKPVVDFILVLTELLFAIAAFVSSQFMRLTDGQTDRHNLNTRI